MPPRRPFGRLANLVLAQANGSGLASLPLAETQLFKGLNPLLNPGPAMLSEKPPLWRENCKLTTKRNTPTGNAACLRMGRHSLASIALSILLRPPCPSLHLAGYAPQLSTEPSPEPWPESGKDGSLRPLLSGETPKPPIFFSYLCDLFVSYFT